MEWNTHIKREVLGCYPFHIFHHICQPIHIFRKDLGDLVNQCIRKFCTDHEMREVTDIRHIVVDTRVSSRRNDPLEVTGVDLLKFLILSSGRERSLIFLEVSQSMIEEPGDGRSQKITLDMTVLH